MPACGEARIEVTTPATPNVSTSTQSQMTEPTALIASSTACEIGQGNANQDPVLTQIVGEYLYAEGPAADAHGNGYFSDNNAGKIYKWSPDGMITIFIEELNRPK